MHRLAFLRKATEFMQLVLQVGQVLVVALFLRSGSLKGLGFSAGMRLLKLLYLPSMLHLGLLCASSTLWHDEVAPNTAPC